MRLGQGSHFVVISNSTSWYVYNFRLPLIQALLESGFRVGVVAPEDEYSSKIQELGCEFYPLFINNKGVNPLREIVGVLGFIKRYKALRPDIVLHFTPKPNIYGSLASRLLGIPCINNIAGLGTAFVHDGWLSKVVKFLYRFSQGAVKKVFFQNSDDMSLFLSSRIVKQQQAGLLPGSGVDLEKYPASPKMDNHFFRFLLISRLIWDKGIGEYAEAAKLIKQKCPHVECQLVGYVDHNNPTAVPESQVMEWHESGVLNWVGRRDDVRPFIAEADCVVLPSYYREGTPRTLLESASMAKPLIAADSIGTREPVDEGVNGYLCKPRDAHDLAKKMEEIVSMTHEERLRMGQASRDKMVKEYDVTFVVDLYLEAVTGILGEKR